VQRYIIFHSDEDSVENAAGMGMRGDYHDSEA